MKEAGTVEKWKNLKSGPDAAAVLVVDYPAYGPEPSVRDLAPLLDVAYGVWGPWPPESCADRSATAYCADWLRQVRDGDVTVWAVLGSCAGAALACFLAGELGHGHRKPAVLLLDPDTVRGEMLHYQFMLAIARLPEVAAAELAALDEKARQVCQSAQVPAAADALAAEYHAVGMRVLPELGIDLETAEEMCARFTQYLDYLVVCWHTGYGASDADTVTILSRGYHPPAGLRGGISHVQVDHADLFADPGVVALASAALRRLPSQFGR